jgi:hypothetical protein
LGRHGNIRLVVLPLNEVSTDCTDCFDRTMDMRLKNGTTKTVPTLRLEYRIDVLCDSDLDHASDSSSSCEDSDDDDAGDK